MAADDTAAEDTPRAPLPQLVLELRDLVVSYVKQETVAPLKQLGRYVGFGIAGAFLLGLGSLLLGVGGLRALQTETGDTFKGDWSWAPYGIMFVTLMTSGVLVWSARRSREQRKARRASA
ncbi:MAG: hypothetical protein FJW86_12320 [Actinobacteria bacterium]|nr:hypothetical protein [Actinomycetota bacterium]